MRPNGGGGGAWHLTFTLSPASARLSPAAGIIRNLLLIKKIFKLKILKMKKMDYISPENVVIKLELSSNVLGTSSADTRSIGGEGDDEEAG